LHRLVDHPHEPVDEHRDAGELRELRSGFVAALGKAEAGEQNQQRAIGQRAAVVARLRLAAEGVLEGLDLGAAAKQIGGVPDEGAGAAKHQAREDARGIAGVHPGRQRADRNGAEPVAQRAVVSEVFADQIRQHPVVGVAVGHCPHDAEAGCIFVLPRIAAEQPERCVDNTDGQQQPARQGARGGCCEAND